jgi:citrate lyase subunit beta/citryl-CoA lyase
MTVRSYLYVPADQPEKLAKATTRGADALVLDLEDGVAPGRKEEAREAAERWLSDFDQARPQIWVRVNNTPEVLDADLRALASAPPHGVLVPKADLETISATVQILDQAGAAAVRIAALIETAPALLAAAEIAAAPRVDHLAIGEADLGVELGIDASDDEREWQPVRMALVVASAAAGIGAPVGPVSTAYRDLDALKASTERLARLGFGGRSAIHPDQIPVINAVFTPDPGEVAEAEKLLAGYAKAQAAGEGVFIDHTGEMADEARVRRARRIVAQAEAARALDG